MDKDNCLQRERFTDLQIAIKATKREAHALRVGNRPGTEREREQLLLKRETQA
jgi:hypothetical protein